MANRKGLVYDVALVLTAGAANAEKVTLRAGAGHPPALAYVAVWDSYFEEELKKRAAELGHEVRLIEAWGTVGKLDTVLASVRRSLSRHPDGRAFRGLLRRGGRDLAPSCAAGSVR